MLFNEPIEETLVANPEPNYPSVSANELLGTVRLDQSKGNDLIKEKIVLAMDTINRQLPFNFQFDDEAKIRKYKRAVCYEASALICEDNLDFDTTSVGQSRGENQLSKLQSLRRVVQHTIADLTVKPRNRVRLV